MTLTSLSRALLVVVPLAFVACTASAVDGVASADNAISGSVEPGATLTTTGSLNLRTGPSTDEDIITTMPRGARVTVMSSEPEHGYYQVAFNGAQGWAYGAYLSGTGQQPSSPDDTDNGADAGTGSTDDGSFNGKTYSDATVLWQGNWDYLVACDSYSRAQGRVVFFCDSHPTREFVDDEAWVAMPGPLMSQGKCRQSARLCKGGKCVVAKIIEKSETSSKWEGSRAVLDALGESSGYSTCARSYGTVTGVTITLQ